MHIRQLLMLTDMTQVSNDTTAITTQDAEGGVHGGMAAERGGGV